MKVYNVLTPFNYSQRMCVVASSMGKAEELFLKEYPGSTIVEIKKHSDYVIVQETLDERI